MDSDAIEKSGGVASQAYLDLELRHAVRDNDLKKVKLSIGGGADVHVLNYEPIRVANRRGYFEIVKYLAENGVDANELGVHLLYHCAGQGHLNLVRYWIEIHGIDIHALDDIAVEWAASSWHLPVVQYLVMQGADARRARRHGNDEIKQWVDKWQATLDLKDKLSDSLPASASLPPRRKI